jgi:hypothetical protein
MPTIKEYSVPNPNLWQQAAREIVRPFRPLLFDVREIEKKPKIKFQSLKLMKEYVQNGYGIIAPYTHFCREDGFAAVFEGAILPWLINKKIHSPVERFMYDENEDFFKFCEKYFAISSTPLTIEDTLRREGYQNAFLGDGKFEHMFKTIDTIKNGGFEPLSLQRGRRAYRGDPTDTFSKTILVLEKKIPDQNYAILFFGFSMDGVKDYSTVRDVFFNFKDMLKGDNKLVLTVGNIFTKDQMMKAVNNDINQLDPWAFGQFDLVSPPAYLNGPR